MFERRTILSASAAAIAVAGARIAHASQKALGLKDVKMDAFNQTPAQKARHAVRFPRQDEESLMDFVEGFKRYQAAQFSSAKGREDVTAYLQARGLPTGDVDLGYEECFDLMMQDPVHAAKVRLGRSCQRMLWDRASEIFFSDADKYLAAMEATDKAGPGILELNPDMPLPDYACHEIHTQPGGFVGNPFAGWIYHWALTQAFYEGQNDYDQVHISIAQNCPIPSDGQVRRILDIGCGSGLSTTAFKERFPDAEVWGIDVGGPMVRYAHHRAVKMGLDVNFAQRLAEDTKFPDGHFDVISNWIMFHEASAEATAKIIPELFRILRPGGLFNHVDTVTLGNPTAKPPQTIPLKARMWENHRLNNEPWAIEYTHTDFPGLLKKAGFTVELGNGTNGTRFPRVVAYKSA
jgi:ubiquinone/menaquinone biosynthesis C-methylase UbiE